VEETYRFLVQLPCFPVEAIVFLQSARFDRENLSRPGPKTRRLLCESRKRKCSVPNGNSYVPLLLIW